MKSMIFVGMASFSAAVASGSTVYTIGGKKVSNSQMKPSSQQELFDASLRHYQQVRRVAEQDVIEKHVDELAKKKGQTHEQVEQELMKMSPPSDKELKAWFDENKARIPYEFEKVKGEIARILSAEKQEAKRAELVEKLTGGKLVLAMAEPQPPKFDIASAGFPTKGNPKAKVTIVEFADYQCGHCKDASGVLAELVKKHGEKVKLVYMDYPINHSGISRKISEGGVCAEKQGKFWEYNAAAFAQQKSLTKESPKALAEKVGIMDIGAFETCLKNAATAEKVDQAFQEGKRIGVAGTPAIYVNGVRVAGYDMKSLEKAVKSAM